MKKYVLLLGLLLLTLSITGCALNYENKNVLEDNKFARAAICKDRGSTPHSMNGIYPIIEEGDVIGIRVGCEDQLYRYKIQPID